MKNKSKTLDRGQLNAIVFPGELEATRAVLEAGKTYGYGNMIAWLMKAWGVRLMREGLSEAAAEEFVSKRSPYRLAGDFPVPFKDIGFIP